MKARTQLLTLVSMATLALGGVTVASGLLLNTPENNSINAATIDEPETGGFFTPGNTLYVKLPASSWWLSDNADIRIATIKQNPSNTYWSEPMTNLEPNGDVDGDGNITLATVVRELPNEVTDNHWDTLVVVRTDPSKTVSDTQDSWSAKWGDNSAQTADYNWWSEFNNADNTFTVNVSSNKWEKSTVTTSQTTHELLFDHWLDENADWWTDSICVAYGQTNEENLRTAWEASAAAFANLGQDVQYWFSTLEGIEGDPVDSDNFKQSCQKAAQRYDLIIGIYGSELGLADWAGRTAN